MVTDSEGATNLGELTASSLAQEFTKTAVAGAVGQTSIEELNKLRNSGLIDLLIPKSYGGWGETLFDAFKVVRQISKADGSLGRLLGCHYANSTIPLLFGTPEQNARLCLHSVRHKWFWGDVINSRDPELIFTPDGENFRLNGVKKFCTGAKGLNVVVVSGVRSDLNNILFAVLPKDRHGIVVSNDWKFMDPSQTDSDSVVFDNVLIRQDEILGNPDCQELPTPFATMITCLYQLFFVNLYLGIALAAFEAAKEYTRSTTSPWLLSPADTATQDPYIIEQYGDLWIDLTATESHVDKVASLFQTAWDKREALTAGERGKVAIEIASAKVLSTRVSLNVTSKIFEIMGAGSGESKYRFERYWRNVRVHTLQEPVVYKVYEVGDWILNKQLPRFTLYT